MFDTKGKWRWMNILSSLTVENDQQLHKLKKEIDIHLP